MTGIAPNQFNAISSGEASQPNEVAAPHVGNGHGELDIPVDMDDLDGHEEPLVD